MDAYVVLYDHVQSMSFVGDIKEVGDPEEDLWRLQFN